MKTNKYPSVSVKRLFLVLFMILNMVGSQAQPVFAAAPAPALERGLLAAFTDCANQAQIPAAECGALVALYNATNGDSWTDHTDWLATDTPCSWKGVACQAGHVTRLNLAGNNLVGSLPTELGDLTGLTQLLMANNKISGNIPTQLGDITTLQAINLTNNLLTGAIPTQLGSLANLDTLALSTNQLSGDIPASLNGLTNLIALNLDNNRLTGTIPDLSALTKLTALRLFQNQLSGAVPAWLGELTSLDQLVIGHNQFSGPLPPELSSLNKLVQLSVIDNKLSGPVPESYTALTSLTAFRSYKNELCEPTSSAFQAWKSTFTGSKVWQGTASCYGKTSPADEATGVSTSPTLTWEASSDNVTAYEYCGNIAPSCPSEGAWVSAALATSVTLNSLPANSLLYWQVRAKSSIAGNISYTPANGGIWWSFFTGQAPPGSFNKSAPANHATGVALNPTLSWGVSADALSYEYCTSVDGAACPGDAWTSVNANTSVALNELSENTTYYWQVRARNSQDDLTYANNGVWWQFTTQIAPPAAFNKTAPSNNAVDQPLNLTLSWEASSPDVTYEYCGSNTNSCPGSWTSVNANTSVTLNGLLAGYTYYWQVRARNSQGGITYANNGDWWSFTTASAPQPPAAFSKTAPANNAAAQPLNPTLSWQASSGAADYEYCLSASGDTCPNDNWTSVGANTSIALSGLAYNTVYYWQARAVNASGTTPANGGTWWQFTTQIAPPVAFNKTAPANNATAQPLNPTLSWAASSGAASYEYCLSTSANTCPGDSWTSVGANTSAALSGLAYNTVYYWQARAVNASGTTPANGGTWWQFTTQIAPPAAFNKTAPANNATGLALNPTLSWAASSGAASYEYCYSTSANTCPGDSWTSVGANTSAALSGLAYNTVYYWQARAVNASGTTSANGGTWWQFTTQIAPPAAFTKTAPANNATAQPLNPTLSWEASSGAADYEYCLSASGDTCPNDNWTSVGANTSVALSGLAYNTVYYWQVRAVNASGTTPANAGTWWQFTTQIAPPAAFNKTAPANNAAAQPLNPTLSWQASSGAASYEYCYSTTANTCPGNSWTSVGSNTSVALSGLAYNTVYYWQARAINSEGAATAANGGTWWRFTTRQAPPPAFSKTSPTNNAAEQPVNLTLTWEASGAGVTYEYCGSNSAGVCPEDHWISVDADTSVTLTGLVANFTYYWQVRARNSQGDLTYANGGTWWSFTTAQALPVSGGTIYLPIIVAAAP